jgi:hypothetical protein
MPSSLIPLLDEAWRKDLTGLYADGKDARLKNTLDGYSSITAMTDDYLLIRVTGRSEMELKRLPLINNTYIICMVTRVEGPVTDSRISFFTTEWQPLEASALMDPVTPEWFIAGPALADSDRYLDALSRLDMDLISYRLSKDDLTLSATYTTPSYLNKSEKESVLRFLKDTPRVYTWDRSGFR